MRMCLAALTLACMAVPAMAQSDVRIPRDDVPFVREAPNEPQRLGRLWGDRATGPAGTLLKVPGHWTATLHAHTADYRGVVIEGVWKHWVPGDRRGEETRLPAGSYWTQKADQPHLDACVSSAPCVILLINEKPYSTYLPQK